MQALPLITAPGLLGMHRHDASQIMTSIYVAGRFFLSPALFGRGRLLSPPLGLSCIMEQEPNADGNPYASDLGPQHPAAHGALPPVLELDGEIVEGSAQLS